MKRKSSLLTVFILIHCIIMAENKLLTATQMQRDLSILKAELKTLHPGLYRYNTAAQIDQYFAAAEKKCNTILEIQSFYLIISELTAKIKCGHTFPNPLNLNDSIANLILPKKVIPLFFKIAEGKIIVTHNLSPFPQIKAGDEITYLNAPAQEIINKLFKVSRADGNNAQDKKLANLWNVPEESYGNSLFDIYFSLYFMHGFGQSLPSPTLTTIQAIIKHRSGKSSELTLIPISTQERKEHYEAKFGPLKTDEKSWEFSILKDSINYLKFGTFAFWNSDFNWKNYLDSVFLQIKNNPKLQTHLIIDLRGNEGGSGEIRDYILSYITPKPITGETGSVICYKSLSIPDSLLPYLSTWDNSFKKPKNPDLFFKNELGLYQSKQEAASNTILPQTNAFKGVVFLLVDAVCSSATFDMANTFKQNKLGLIVGAPTGGSKQGLNGGEMFFCTLPNSKIEVDIPLIFYYRKGAEDKGVLPNHVIYPSPASIAQGIDRELDYTIDLAKGIKNRNDFLNPVINKHGPINPEPISIDITSIMSPVTYTGYSLQKKDEPAEFVYDFADSATWLLEGLTKWDEKYLGKHLTITGTLITKNGRTILTKWKIVSYK